jgi:glycerophosphoryl diester phosphodiesterase
LCLRFYAGSQKKLRAKQAFAERPQDLKQPHEIVTFEEVIALVKRQSKDL